MGEFTPGCLRAADRLAKWRTYSRNKIAAIIAEETAQADLYAALEAIIADAESGQCEEDILTTARAALRKADGKES